MFAIVWLVSIAAVLWLTHIPQVTMPQGFGTRGVDKLLHAGAYGWLTLMGFLSFGNRSTGRYLLIAAVLAGLGIADELTQPFVDRSCSLGDYIADLVGIGIVAVGAIGLMKFRIKRGERQ